MDDEKTSIVQKKQVAQEMMVSTTTLNCLYKGSSDCEHYKK